MSIVYHTELIALRKQYEGKKIIYCSGTFDLTHAGHVLFFEDCKKLGDILFVSIGSDVAIRKHKNQNRPILNEHLRLKLISSLKPVDYCYVEKMIDHSPIAHLDDTFKQLRPDVYVVNDDNILLPERQESADRFGVKMVVLPRFTPPEFEQISTSRIIEKIKNI